MPRPKAKKLAVRLSVSLPAGHYAVLQRLADRDERSLAGMVRKAVAEYIDRHDAGEQEELPLSMGSESRSA